MNSCGKDEILRHPTYVIRGGRFQSSFGSTDIIIYGPYGAPDSKIILGGWFHTFWLYLARYVVNSILYSFR